MCDWDYPPGFVNQIQVSRLPNAMNTKWVCSPCALELYNLKNKTNHKTWPQGLMAETQRQLCEDLRANAPLSARPRKTKH